MREEERGGWNKVRKEGVREGGVFEEELRGVRGWMGSELYKRT